MDEGIEVDDIVSETEDMTLLAQYDAVCRNFDGPGCDTGNNPTRPRVQPFSVSRLICNRLSLEFSVFAQSQEECRLKWLRTQNEIARVKFALREAKEYTAKLEALTHHTQSDLKSEINARTRAQKEKRALVRNYFYLCILTYFPLLKYSNHSRRTSCTQFETC